MVATSEFWRWGTALKSEGAGMDTSASDKRGVSSAGVSNGKLVMKVGDLIVALKSFVLVAGG